MDVLEKLEILTETAKYDVACTSSGSSRGAKKGSVGNTVQGGICHSFAADGRCISLLKILMTNKCAYDCKYCVNRVSNDPPRASLTPRELADITISFYKRNYIEGLFLSSGVERNPDYAMEQMYHALKILREEYRFNGYIHVKGIPGASQEIIAKTGNIVDRMSINIEMPSESSLKDFAPQKAKQNILAPMTQIRDTIVQTKHDMVLYKHTPSFVPSGQATQMVIGASPDTDFQIVRLAESLYKRFSMRRVFYSAYIPVGTHALLPQNTPPPLLREHRLYQADFLIRFYGFKANEILSEDHPHLDPLLDPKCNWAMNNLHLFPVEVNTASREVLLRVPGIGQGSADKIIAARRIGSVDFDALKRMHVVLKRAVYFITCRGKTFENINMREDFIYQNLVSSSAISELQRGQQMTLFGDSRLLGDNNLPVGLLE